MNFVPPRPLRLTYVDTDDTVRIELHGDFDHACADGLLDGVMRLLADRSDLRNLHLHCGNITAVDSTGLATLLMIRRHTDTAGVRLHLVDRTARLDRMLRLTGTLEHLTDTSDSTTSGAAQEQTTAAQEAIPARSGGSDAT
ncbi:STAS domain-containing protein [Streptomyces sp. NPDC058289]|uniref:STAS domain-containing protein n=1 Tax=Streptomyces sp. NPDC058289 TaxID=3346425 RepID=UPI0036EA2290